MVLVMAASQCFINRSGFSYGGPPLNQSGDAIFCPQLLLYSKSNAAVRFSSRARIKCGAGSKNNITKEEEKPQQQKSQINSLFGVEAWDVPWGFGLTGAGLVGWILSYLISGLGVAALARRSGIEKIGLLDVDEQSLFLLVNQVIQTAAGLATIDLIVRNYKPLPSDWFLYDIRKPFDLQKGWLLWSLLGVLFAGGAVFLSGMIAAYFNNGELPPREGSDSLSLLLPLIGASPLSTGSLIIVTGGLAPLLEETVFRGFLLASLTKWLPVPVAVVLSSAGFAVAHLTPSEFPQLFALGLVIGFAYARTHNMLTPVLIHSVWNSGVLVILTILILNGYDVPILREEGELVVVVRELGQSIIKQWGPLVNFHRHDEFYHSMHARALLREQDELAALVKSVRELAKAREVHEKLLQSPHKNNRYLANLLVEMYGKCGSLSRAQAVFDDITEPNNYSWNILMGAYTRNGCLDLAKSTFDRMSERCSVSWTSMTRILCQAYHPCSARNVFEKMPAWNSLAWNTVITAYAQSRHPLEAREVFNIMPERNDISWGALLDAYASSEELEEAKVVFDKAPLHGVVYCTSMLHVYAESSCSEAKQMFDRMPQRDKVSWNAMISASSAVVVQDVFDKLPQRDVVSWTALLQAFSLAGRTDSAKQVFDEMPERDIVPWTTLMSCFSQLPGSEQAFATSKQVFDKMPQWDVVSSTAFLEAQSRVSPEMASSYFFSSMRQRNVVSWTSTLASYARNLQLGVAKMIFNRMPGHTLVSWNSILAAHANAGDAESVIHIFNTMALEGLPGDQVTFLILLVACNHFGQVSEGREYFLSMSYDYGVAPVLGHYSCMAALLGRCGQVGSARGLAANMPVSADAVVWSSVVGASKLHQDLECGLLAAKSGLKMSSMDSFLNLSISRFYAESASMLTQGGPDDSMAS